MLKLKPLREQLLCLRASSPDCKLEISDDGDFWGTEY